MFRHIAGSALAGVLVFAAASAAADGRLVEIESAIAVVDREQLEASGVTRDISDIVNLAPGVVGVARQPGDLLPRGTGTSGLNLRGVTNALEQSGTVTILGRPSATVDVGSTLPIALIERIEILRDGASTLYGSAGVGLNIVPRIAGDGKVTLDLGIDSRVPYVIGDDLWPGRRYADSTVTIGDGQTVVIGGLFGDSARGAAGTIPVLGDLPTVGDLFAGDGFRSGRTDLTVFITPTVLGGGGTPRVGIETHFIEIPVDFFDGIDIDFADELPEQDLWQVKVGIQQRFFDPYGLGGPILADPRSTAGDGESARIEVGDKVDVPRPGGGLSTFDAGLSLTWRPRLLDDGRIALNVDYAGGYPGLDMAGQPQLQIRRIETDVLIEDGQTVVLGGLFGPGAGEAARDIPALGDLPTLGRFFRNAGVGRETNDLMLMVTPRIIIQEEEENGGGASTGGASAGVHDYQKVDPTQIVITPGIGYGYQGLPTFGWSRLELGAVIQERPIVAEDADVSGAEFRLGLSAGLEPLSWWGRDTKLGLDLRYLDASTESFTQLIPANGNRLGVESPQGTGLLFAIGFSDIEDLRFRGDYEAVDVTLKVTETIDLNFGRLLGGYDEDDYYDDEDYDKAMDVYGGLRISHVGYDAMSSFLTNAATSTLERQDEVKTWTFGPAFGATLSHSYGDFKSFGGIDLMAGIGIADGYSETFINGGSFGNFDETETAFVYNLGLNAGLRYEKDNWNVELRGEISLGNRNAAVEYQPFDPAEIVFDSQFSGFAGFRLGYRFRF